MKKFVVAVMALLYSFIGVHWVFAAGNTWIPKVNLTKTRDLAVSFSIGDKGYMGTGYAGGVSKDFWEFNPATNIWTQKADFGGAARYCAVGFAIGERGYLGTGTDGTQGNTHFKDFWEYNPATNAWIKKADFGGGARYGAAGFFIGNKGYIGTGRSTAVSSLKDFWEYDPAGDIWIRKADFGGNARVHAVGLSVGTKGYFGTGNSNGSMAGIYFKDFWEYDPENDTWTRKADFEGAERLEAVGFSIGDKGYIGTGGQWGRNGTVETYVPPVYYKDFWEYDPANDHWTRQADVGGDARTGASGFSIDGKGYIGAGKILYVTSYGYVSYTATLDFWEYEPADTTPDQFIFNYETDVELNTVITSNTITVSGINAPAPIRVEGGTYAINGGLYTSETGKVNNGDTVTVQQTSSGNYLTTTEATLSIGEVSDTFSVITKEESIITLNPVADKTILWPPNNKMVPVTIQANAHDSSGKPVVLTATVSCNEPARLGRDWTTPVINQKTGVIFLALRAIRLGNVAGRIYTITITATGTDGNSAAKTVTVTVPHDQRNRGRR